MKTNLGAIDGTIRVLLFVVSIIFAIMTGQWGWTIPAGILFATAVVSWCPLYAILGVHDNKPETGL